MITVNSFLEITPDPQQYENMPGNMVITGWKIPCSDVTITYPATFRPSSMERPYTSAELGLVPVFSPLSDHPEAAWVRADSKLSFRDIPFMKTIAVCRAPDGRDEMFSSFTSENPYVRKIILAHGITTVPPRAFAGSPSLIGACLPDTVRDIGEEAFRDCPALREAVIPRHVREIRQGTFEHCSALEKIILPSSLEAIRGRAFFDCGMLADPVFPDNISFIGDQAFRFCDSLKSVWIPDSVGRLGRMAFADCTGLTDISMKGGTQYDANVFFSFSGKLRFIRLRH